MIKSHDKWIADYVESRFHAAIQSGNRRAHYAVLAIMRSGRYETPKARKMALESARQWADWATQDYSDAIGFAAKGNTL